MRLFLTVSLLASTLLLSGCTLDSGEGAEPAQTGSGGAGSSIGGGGSGWASGGEAGVAGAAGMAGMAGMAGAAGAGDDAGAGGTTGSGGAATGGTTGSGGTATGGTGGTTNACPRVKIHVAAGAMLNVRPTPSTAKAAVGQLDDGAIVDVLAQVKGEVVGGNDVWFQIKAPNVTGYVSAQFATCTLEKPPVVTAPDGYYLPLACGKSAKIAQGNFGSFSHQGNSAYAYDFSIGLNTPMVAMADGVVKYLYNKTGPGDPCYNGGGSSCFPYANYVVILHGDGKLSTYKHLNKVNVSLGQTVKRGTVIGLSGSTGYSTGPHAHVMRMDDCGKYSCQSIPLKFVDVGGDHVPNTGETVKSGNCP